jgi:hypothetical protein
VLPDVSHVAVFDTSFHQTLAAHAYTYAVPVDWLRRYGVRRYGFHGTSVAFVSRRAARLLNREPADVNLIVLHLGNGASATAVERGRGVDTSMGLTALEGLVMGTRSGDIDPALVFHLQRTAGLDVDELDRVLNSASGMKALAGASDLREVHARGGRRRGRRRRARGLLLSDPQVRRRLPRRSRARRRRRVHRRRRRERPGGSRSRARGPRAARHLGGGLSQPVRLHRAACDLASRRRGRGAGDANG